MKWMIASDIHGSAFWCGLLLRAFETERADRLLLLGDILYHGPRNDLPADYAPKEVAAQLNTLRGRVFGVRGNCDAEIDQMLLDFPSMAENALLPAGRRLIFATHGHVFNKDHLPPLSDGDIVLHGHTHVPCWTEAERGIRVFNPGSVSIPKEGTPHGYMLLDGETAEWKSLDGETYHREVLE